MVRVRRLARAVLLAALFAPVFAYGGWATLGLLLAATAFLCAAMSPAAAAEMAVVGAGAAGEADGTDEDDNEAGPVISPDAIAVLDAVPDACVILTADGTIVQANAAAREQFGLFHAGRPFTFAMRTPELLRAIEQVSRSGAPERARWSEKVPTNRWYEAVVSPLTVDGSPALALFVRDLTEQQRLERMREDFVANASHELRTPLAALTGFIETLQGPAKDDAAARELFLGVMREQAERMRRLTDALLSLSRIEMRAHVRPTDVVDCARIVRTAVEMARGLAEENKVVLELTMDAGELPVRGDADELIQVLDNLIENAIKYGGKGGRIVVTAAREEGSAGPVAALSVQDFGAGIPPEHVPRLTERFYRVDVEASRQRQGTGLGLAIVKHIVARHRGRLTVRSEVGSGSKFTVRIPFAAPGKG